MGSESLHEPRESLSDETVNLHRAVVSLIEELEAIDWYQQRAEACTDEALRAVLLHNKNEEVEHAFMTLEWLRRRDPMFDSNARQYLFSSRPIHEIEDEDSSAETTASAPAPDSSLGIGSLKG